MHETATAFLHFDAPGAGQPLKAGGDTVRGWLVPKPGRHYTDLRLVADGKYFLGIHGFPRPDLTDFFRSSQPCLFAEFAIPVRLPAGRTRLGLEGWSIQGAWTPIDSLEIEVVAAGEPAPEPPVMPIRAYESAAAMQVLLRQLGGDDQSIGGAVGELLDATPYPHILRLPHLPFHGHIDEPWCWSRTVFGRLTVVGCVFHETQPIKRVFATTDLQAMQELAFGRESALYASHHTRFPQAGACGFDGVIDVPAQMPRPFALRVYAELADGTWHLTSVVRATNTDQELAKQSPVPYSPLIFWRTWRRLRRDAEARGFTFESGPELWRALFKAWNEYRARAPRRTTSPAAVRPRRISPGGGLRRVHLITHNLNHEGAPLFLLELARHLHHEAGCDLSVTSGVDGPLRREFEALGAAVRTVDPSPLFAAENPAALRQAIRHLAVPAELAAADLVIVNTLSAFWGIHLAHQAGRPSLYYIHESTTPAAFFHGHLHPDALPVVEEAFRLADRVSFLTATTQRYYNGLSDGSNYCLNPGWINLAGIDEFRRTHAREAERIALDVEPGRRLVVNIGTVCDRKGQHVFARAVDLLWRIAPELAAPADFRMVGGRDTSYDRALAGFLSTLGRPNVRIVAETEQVYRYYAAADLFACSSYEESFPRVVLEAMAFELPIVSSGVHGIPEIVRPDREAVLVTPGDSAALAAGLQRLLAAPAAGRELAAAARWRVAAEFDARLLLPRHAALARAVAAGQG